MIRIAIFASGSGTNAQKIIGYFTGHPSIQVAALLSNKPDAYALVRAENAGIPTYTFTRDEFYKTTKIARYLEKMDVLAIILAGFLWLVPEYLIKRYPGRVINIHPALLPKYGGKGMYGMRVHRAIIENGEKESGITIHQVNEHYDEGDIIFQTRCRISSDDTPESLAAKIHELEYKHYPRVIEEWLTNLMHE